MLWKRRDMGSDPMNPVYVTTDIPVTNDKVTVNIPIAAYKRLVDWCSMGRTMDNVIRNLEQDADKQSQSYANEEMEMLRQALCEIHESIRQHYIMLPGKEISK